MKEEILTPFNKIYFVSLLIAVFLAGFLLSSGLVPSLVEKGLDQITPKIKDLIAINLNKLDIYPDAWQYFLLPKDKYVFPYPQRFSLSEVFSIAMNAMFNSLFQPVFLCIFTPQTILNCMLFPFFIYGAVIYFRRVPLVILFFLAFSLYIGMKDFVVEPLIRHRMSCELIYLLIGTAGFTGWITKKSS